MKEGSGSGSSSARLEKDRRPFGCLIIKKKGDGISSSSSNTPWKQMIFESKEKNKRPRLIPSDSESDKDLLISPRRMVINRDSNVCVVKNSSIDSFKRRKEIGIYRERIRSDPHKCRGDARVGGNRFVEAGIERMKCRMDVSEYTKDDVFDKKRLKGEHLDDKGIGLGRNTVLGSNSLVPSGKKRKFEIECRKSLTVDKRERHKFDGNISLLVQRNRGADCTDKMRSVVEKNGTFCPVGSENLVIPCSEPIRVQGKNGVLKVMLNNKKVDVSKKTYGLPEVEENMEGFRPADTSYWKSPLSPPVYLEKTFCERSPSVLIMERNQVNSRKNLSTKNNEACDWSTQASDISLQLGSKNMVARSSKKVVMNKGERTLTSKINPSTRCKEREVRNNHGTEKQLLRERIRSMLVNAGWKIDFRPRKNRNYHDAVYINPLGTEYWSILKAYHALQKQCDEEGNGHQHSGTSSFTPIPEEVLGQLTRKTHKKSEREMMLEHKADGGSKNVKETTERKLENKHFEVNIRSSTTGKKMSSFIMRDGKSVKVKIKGNGIVANGDCSLHKQGNSSGFLQKRIAKPAIIQRPSSASDADILQVRKSKQQSGHALLVRISDKAVNSDDNTFIPYTGKRTVLSWLIDMGTVSLSGKVQYMNKKRTRALLEGWITRDGIHCGCCSKILTVSKFEIHAGSKLRQPFQNIYVESGVSLMQCQLNAWDKQKKSERSGFHFIDFDGDDLNDDTCGICGDGGNLICCDGCPSTFHQSCLGIQRLPLGDWHCPNCSCKFCGLAGGGTGQSKDVSSSELCTCAQCERKYHQLCSQGTDAICLDSNSLCTSFCGQNCRELFQQLQKLLGVKYDLESGFSWMLIQRSGLDSDTPIRGLPQKAECNSKLAVALTVLNECFLPIIDRRSGINLIHNVLYNCGSNFNRLNFSGFYTVILERGDEIVSAASVRILGTKVAEMPFIGTRHIYRRQGMCRQLLNAIESVLLNLNVEKLIIPAISEVMHTWSTVFGFKPLEESQKQEMRFMNMLIFPGTDLLQKPLLKHTLTEENVSDGSVVKATELKSKHHNMSVVIDKSDIGYSVGPDIHASGECVVHHAHEVNNEVASIKTGSEEHSCSIYDTVAHGLILHARGDESAPDTGFALCSGVTCHNKLEVESRHICSSPVDPKLQSFTEDNAPEVNVRVSDAELDLHSLAETSVQHTANMIAGYPNAVSGNSFHSTGGSPGQSNSHLNHHKMHDVECRSTEFCCVVPDAIHGRENGLGASGDGTEQDTCDVKTEDSVVASEPYTSDEGQALRSTDNILPARDDTFVDSFQSSGVNVVCHNSERISQTLGTISQYHAMENEVALDKHSPQDLGEDSVDCTFEAVGESLYTSPKCNYLASPEFKYYESVQDL